ncbi:MAG: hypothetical protein J5897_06475 [Candidatus Methanomethylophilus sp.]|nr:hypothetical protein [Methanomethylophilus sp.]
MAELNADILKSKAINSLAWKVIPYADDVKNLTDNAMDLPFGARYALYSAILAETGAALYPLTIGRDSIKDIIARDMEGSGQSTWKDEGENISVTCPRVASYFEAKEFGKDFADYNRAVGTAILKGSIELTNGEWMKIVEAVASTKKYLASADNRTAAELYRDYTAVPEKINYGTRRVKITKAWDLSFL